MDLKPITKADILNCKKYKKILAPNNKGLKNHKCKVKCHSEINVIRFLDEPCQAKEKHLAEIYGYKQKSSINHICSGLNWGHIPFIKYLGIDNLGLGLRNSTRERLKQMLS